MEELFRWKSYTVPCCLKSEIYFWWPFQYFHNQNDFLWVTTIESSWECLRMTNAVQNLPPVWCSQQIILIFWAQLLYIGRFFFPHNMDTAHASLLPVSTIWKQSVYQFMKGIVHRKWQMVLHLKNVLHSQLCSWILWIGWRAHWCSGGL